MNKRLRCETERLTRSWSRWDRGQLRDYLVRDVEDPRINLQSILSRHFITEQRFGPRFTALQTEELRFGAVMNWLGAIFKSAPDRTYALGLLDALLDGAETTEEGLAVPRFALDAFAAMPATVDGVIVPNYIASRLLCLGPIEDSFAVPDYVLSTFHALWIEVLEPERDPALSVLEPACGSANDYRFIDAFGLGHCIDYTGFDLCPKNVRNAQHMFPAVRFQVGNVLEIQAPDKAYDCCYVHDLFEHLSIEAYETAIEEVCRVTRRGLCLAFFNMEDRDDHVVRPVREYHWNTLSLAKTIARLERHGARVQPIHIDGLLRTQFGYAGAHNPHAYTLLVTM